MKTLWRWVVYFWWAKIRRKPETVCPPNCKLCEVQVRINAHYDACPTCQGLGYPCAAMTPLCEEEDRATEELFPWTKDYANTTASSIPVQVLPPWDWSKK